MKKTINMEIKKIKKKKSNIYEIILSDNTSLSFYDETIIRFNLLSNKKIDYQKLKEICIYNQKLDAYYHALKFINIKLRTKKDICQKLLSLNYPEDAIKKTIERLTKEGYLNDDLYIKSYINDAISLSLKGPNKISRELIQKELPKEKIAIYLDEIDNNIWHEKIEKIIAKRIKSNHNFSNNMLIIKVKNDLRNLGYPKEIVNIVSFPKIDEQDILEKEYNKELKKLSRKYNGNALKNKIKYNLYKKGFNLTEIEKILSND